MNFAGYQIPECNVSFDAIPSLLVEYKPHAFEGWEVVEDLNGRGYWFRSCGGRSFLSGDSLHLVIAFCEYVKCDLFVWTENNSFSLHFVPGAVIF